MKRKTAQGGSKLVKTSVSLPDVLVKFAEEQISKEGFNSLSAYLAHLVRLHKAEVEGTLSRPHPATSGVQYPTHREGLALAAEEAPKGGVSSTPAQKADQALKQGLLEKKKKTAGPA